MPNAPKTKPKLAVWKFASCDGCQLSLLDCEDEILALGEGVQIAQFLEASRAVIEGPYDLSLVEGSITTPHDRERIQAVRRVSKKLVTIGACATSGGIQALRNFSDAPALARAVYAHPEYLSTLASSTPIAAHVRVDFELRGCPVDKRQLLEVVTALLADRRPAVRAHSVCIECKRAGHTCVLVTGAAPCLGPITHAGCGALCPGYARGCFGCFGPAEGTESAARLTPALRGAGADERALQRLYASFNVGAEAWLPLHRLQESAAATAERRAQPPKADKGRR